MEELLNKLIEKGWKPFGWEVREAKKGSYNNLYYGFDSHPELYHIRMLVSKESGLWQFVYDNGMIDIDPNYVKKRMKRLRYVYDEIWENYNEYFDEEDYEYRVIESALCNEDKLENFLLNNIKIDD